MRKYKGLNFFIVAVLFFSCTPSQRITSAWTNPDKPEKPYSTVFIGALIQNNPIKYAIEADLGKAAQARGFKVVKGYEIFPPNFNKENMRDKDLVLKLIKDRGCDVILSIAVIDVKSETRYVSGGGVHVGYMPYGGYGPYHGSYGMYGTGFYGYYNYWSTSLYDPGYYTTDKTYFIEANAYDTETQQLIWSVQSKAYNPSGIEKSSQEYTEILMDQFDKDRKKSLTKKQ